MNKQILLIALILAFGVSAKADPTTTNTQPAANMPQKISHSKSKTKPMAVKKQDVTRSAATAEKSTEVKADTAMPPAEKKN